MSHHLLQRRRFRKTTIVPVAVTTTETTIQGAHLGLFKMRSLFQPDAQIIARRAISLHPQVYVDYAPDKPCWSTFQGSFSVTDNFLADARRFPRSHINRCCDFVRPRLGAKPLRPCEAALCSLLTRLAVSPAGKTSLRPTKTICACSEGCMLPNPSSLIYADYG